MAFQALADTQVLLVNQASKGLVDIADFQASADKMEHQASQEFRAIQVSADIRVQV